MQEPDMKGALDAFTKAWTYAKRYGDEAAKASMMADLVSSARAKKLFAQSAKRAVLASEKYRKAADICLKVMDEMGRKMTSSGKKQLTR